MVGTSNVPPTSSTHVPMSPSQREGARHSGSLALARDVSGHRSRSAEHGAASGGGARGRVGLGPAELLRGSFAMENGGYGDEDHEI